MDHVHAPADDGMGLGDFLMSQYSLHKGRSLDLEQAIFRLRMSRLIFIIYSNVSVPLTLFKLYKKNWHISLPQMCLLFKILPVLWVKNVYSLSVIDLSVFFKTVVVGGFYLQSAACLWLHSNT